MKLVPNAVSRKFARQLLVAQKNSPTILFGAGVVGMLGSTVLACRATLKVEEVLAKTRDDLSMANNMEHPEYSADDRKKDVAIIYTRSAVKLVKLYGPSLLLGVASVGCLTKSHNILQQRNLALTAAYAAIDKAFSEYRARVVDKYGEEQDQEFRYSTEQVEVITDKGKLVTETRVDPDAASLYARFFDQLSPSWSKNAEYNLVFLKCQQSYANDMLKTRGHVFLNEVYDWLGIDRSKAGSVVGWVISEDGDNFIDFGIYGENQQARNFVNGREGAILLDFNVDGIIYDKIDNQDRRPVAWQS